MVEDTTTTPNTTTPMGPVPNADVFVTVMRPKTSKNPNSFWLVLKDNYSGMIQVSDGQGGVRFKYTKRLLVKPKTQKERDIQTRQASNQGPPRQSGYQPTGGYGSGYGRSNRGGYGRSNY